MQKNTECQATLGENTCLTVIQKMEVITELGLADGMYLRLQIP